tara:strand:- start:54 stop:233 length:180 start_codon:yes stop_codon:yes gene_type:complete
METNWAIIDNNMIVTGLWAGNIDTGDVPIGGMIKYSAPFESRGTPSIGQTWDNETETFE